MYKLLPLLLIIVSVSVYGQTIPSYIPKDSLVAWYPFNGNANDESGNGHNGTVNGASLTVDRFGDSNSAYSFNAVDDTINLSNSSNFSFGTGNFTLSTWFYSDTLSGNVRGALRDINFTNGKYYEISPRNAANGKSSFGIDDGTNYYECFGNNIPIDNRKWHLLTGVWISDTMKYYIDGQFQNYLTLPISVSLDNLNSLRTGAIFYQNGKSSPVVHKIDDIGIWNRALDSAEIQKLFTGCKPPTVSITPSTTFVNIKTDSISFTGNPTGGAFSGNGIFGGDFYPASAGLGSKIVTYSYTDGQGCTNTASADVMVYDTVTCSLTVTDTLVINAHLTGVNPPDNLNTLKIFPNPAKDHITIDYGNYGDMKGYMVTITNSIGQTVFSTTVTAQQSYIDLNTWSGKGIYTINITDTSSHIIDVKKIVVQ